jgi:hypothetical protein
VSQVLLERQVRVQLELDSGLHPERILPIGRLSQPFAWGSTVRRRLFGASLAIAALLIGAGGAQATPIGQTLWMPQGPRFVSAKIFLSDSPRLFWELPLAAVIGESVAREAVLPLAAGNPGLAFSVESPFPSPVSLTLQETDLTIALETVGDPRELREDGP